MNKQFESDVDPKRIRDVADGLRRQGEFESSRMLHAYADRLEADENEVGFCCYCGGKLDQVTQADAAMAQESRR